MVKGRNSIVIKEPSDHAIREGYKYEIEVNHLPLDIIKLDQQLLDPSKPPEMTYIETVSYLSIQDLIHLEGNESLDEVRDCPKCGGQKSVNRTGRVDEPSGRKKTIWLQCEKCGAEFRDISVQVGNHIEIQD